MATPLKHCPGYGAQGPHELPATPEWFSRNAPAKDGLYSMCRKDAYAYQGDWGRRRRAIAKADALEPGVERDQALDAAYTMPPIPKRKAVIDTVAVTKPEPRAAQREVVRTGLINILAGTHTANDVLAELATPGDPGGGTADDWAEEHRNPNPTRGLHFGLVGPGTSAGTSCPLCNGWVDEQVGDTTYLMPGNPKVVGTPEGQRALEVVNQAIVAERRRRDAERKRAERAAKKVVATA